FLEIDSRANPDRYRDGRRERNHVDAADERVPDAGRLREARREARDERPRQAGQSVVQYVVEQRGERAQRERQHQQAARLQQPVVSPTRVGRGGHVYTSRKRPRSQLLAMFSTNVVLKSSMPTAKIVLYSMLPVAVSPSAICTMNAVMV